MSLICAYGFARPIGRTRLTGFDEAPVERIERGNIALLGSAVDDVEPDPWEGVVAHNRVLSEALADGPLVPLQPGYMVDRANCQSLLAGEYERIDRLLDRFAGRVEAKVEFSYHDEDLVVREIVSERPQLARGGGEYRARVRLGEEIVNRLAHKRATDSRPLLDALAACSEATVRHDEGELNVLNASFLVDQENVDEFEQTLGRLQAQHAHRMALKYIAPLPFYSFVDRE